MTEEQRTSIIEMVNQGVNVTEICRRLLISWDSAHRVIDPEYAARRNAQTRASRFRDRELRKSAAPHFNVVDRYRPHDADIRYLKKLIPADTRSITGRICGDPLPGRSALDQRRSV